MLLNVSTKIVNDEYWSVDVSDNEYRGGACRLFKFQSDAEHWLIEQFGIFISEDMFDLEQGEIKKSWFESKRYLTSNER